MHGSAGDDIKMPHKKPKVGGGAPKSKRPEGSPQTNGKWIKQEPSEDFQEFVRVLKENVSVDEIREILRENGQDASGSDQSVIDRCADQMVYGPMEACPICGGSLELVGSSYSCMGFISEWSKCSFSTRDISRTNANLNIPSGVKNEFIEEWSRNYQASTDRPKRELPPTDQPFSGMTIAFAGRMSRSKYVWRRETEKHGGRVSNTIGEGVTCVVAPETDLERGGSSILVEATERSIPVVKEAWLVDSIAKEKAQPLERYGMVAEFPGGKGIPWDKRTLEDEAAESLMAEVHFPSHHLQIFGLHKFLSLLLCLCFYTSIDPNFILTPLLGKSIKH